MGGSGWATKTAEWFLTEKSIFRAEDLTFYGSFNRKEKINSTNYMVQEWLPKKLKAEVSLFMPFGFLTVDKYKNLGKFEYLKKNRELIKKSIEFIGLNKPDRCVVFSSGIANSGLQISPRSEAYTQYAQLKIEEEIAIREACMKTKTNLVICRLYSASGRHMTDPNRYALGNFIVQALNHSRIKVSSNFPTYRRYVDMAQLIEICFKLTTDHKFIEFESGGKLVEIRELAKMVGQELKCEVESSGEPDETKVDKYYSDSQIMEKFAEQYSIDMYELQTQINETRLGVIDYLGRNL